MAAMDVVELQGLRGVKRIGDLAFDQLAFAAGTGAILAAVGQYDALTERGRQKGFIAASLEAPSGAGQANMKAWDARHN
jgi:hypothetical protein